MRARFQFLSGLILFTLIAPAAPASGYVPENATVELHAHLFMNEGLGVFFRGDFFGPLIADDYTDKLSSQTNPESVNKSGIGVLVVSLYAHILGTLDRRASIRRQIVLAQRFVKENPQWIIARTAGKAKAAIAEGKRVIILALEGAGGIIETPDDVEEFIGKHGIRIVTLLHLTDDQFGGAAFLGGVKNLASPFAWIRSLFGGEKKDGVKINDLGLTDEGARLAAELIKRKVWIDVAHASDHAQKRLVPLLKESGQPLLFTHMPLRKYIHAERGISHSVIEEVSATGGVIGVMPSEDMLGATHESTECGDGLASLSAQYSEVAKVIGANHTVFGTDFNGGVRHLGKPKCPTQTPLDAEGFWNIGQTGDLWSAMKVRQATLPKRLADTVDTFLTTWERLNP